MGEEEHGTWMSRKELLELRALAQHDLARIQQLEEALEELRESFESRMKRTARLVDEGELNDYWRGNRDALEVCLHKLDALFSSEVPVELEE